LDLTGVEVLRAAGLGVLAVAALADRDARP